MTGFRIATVAACGSRSSATRVCASSTTGPRVVLDPGVFSEAEALDGATAVLITHEHADHVHPDLLRRSDAPIWTIEAVARLLREQAPDVAERVTVVRPGIASTCPDCRSRWWATSTRSSTPTTTASTTPATS